MRGHTSPTVRRYVRLCLNSLAGAAILTFALNCALVQASVAKLAAAGYDEVAVRAPLVHACVISSGVGLILACLGLAWDLPWVFVSGAIMLCGSMLLFLTG